MRIAVVNAAVLVGAVLAAGAAAALAAPRPHKGKVVRVERTRSSNTPPRVCEIHTDGSGVCIGAEPVIGDVVMVMNDTGVVAETKITEATGFSTGSAQVCGALWNVKSDILRGDLTNVTARNFGVVDAEIHPQKGRIVGKEQTVVSPGDASDTVIVAVDRDGDRTADIIVVQSNCDGTSPHGGGACLDSWARVKGRMVRVQQTNFATCGI